MQSYQVLRKRLLSLDNMDSSLFCVSQNLSHKSITRLLTIQHQRCLLQTQPTCLHKQEVNNESLYSQPHIVRDVVLPLRVGNSNWVGVLVEDEGARNEEIVKHKSSGSEVEGQNFNNICDLQDTPTCSEEDVEEEDHGQYTLGNTAGSTSAI
ncbi:hypothetical protein HG531_004693 [Fusarium graminearum]|nr:hypothetical protein HG531_004693 [Fusarium graminearum]